jgi:hypothetical protein
MDVHGRSRGGTLWRRRPPGGPLSESNPQGGKGQEERTRVEHDMLPRRKGGSGGSKTAAREVAPADPSPTESAQECGKEQRGKKRRWTLEESEEKKQPDSNFPNRQYDGYEFSRREGKDFKGRQGVI